MDKLSLLDRVKELYGKGNNIIQYLRELNDSNENTIEDILISYDFQAGTYSESAIEKIDIRKAYCAALADIINQLGDYDSLMEVGVGEATTLSYTLQALNHKPVKVFGFDISWSRIKYGNIFLANQGFKDEDNIQLCTGDLFHAPFLDSSIDIVYTSHSLEPNGGREKEALKELLRITNKYLVLLEPAFEMASDEAKKRMLKNGYVTQLHETAKKLGCDIQTYRLFHPTPNPLNPTGLMIIKKENPQNNEPAFACPITKTSLKFQKNAYFSEESLLAFPVLDGIPCLLPQNAIIATHFND